MNVFVCTYIHKHGTDVGTYRSEAGAESAAWQLANQRVDESWDDEAQTAKFKAIDVAADALNYFHEVERDTSYGEEFEITKTELAD